MDTKDINTSNILSDTAARHGSTPTAQAGRRPWVTPSFERIPLNEALSGNPNFYANDGFLYYS